LDVSKDEGYGAIGAGGGSLVEKQPRKIGFNAANSAMVAGGNWWFEEAIP
jgi:hypothetical protein